MLCRDDKKTRHSIGQTRRCATTIAGTTYFADKGNSQAKPALSKIKRKPLLRAGHCARLFERSVGVFFLIQPREASFAAPCSQKIGLKWQANDKRGILNKFNSRAEERATIFASAGRFSSFLRSKRT